MCRCSLPSSGPGESLIQLTISASLKVCMVAALTVWPVRCYPITHQPTHPHTFQFELSGCVQRYSSLSSILIGTERCSLLFSRYALPYGCIPKPESSFRRISGWVALPAWAGLGRIELDWFDGLQSWQARLTVTRQAVALFQYRAAYLQDAPTHMPNATRAEEVKVGR